MQQPLGPNVASFLGHSDLRVSIMGLLDATDHKVTPSEDDMRRMKAVLEGMGFSASTMSLTWDMGDGDRAWSRSLPSTYANGANYGGSIKYDVHVFEESAQVRGHWL